MSSKNVINTNGGDGGGSRKPSRKPSVKGSSSRVVRPRSPINPIKLVARRPPTVTYDDDKQISVSCKSTFFTPESHVLTEKIIFWLALVTQPIPDLADWSTYEKRVLAQIRPDEWVNIPANIVESFSLLTTHSVSVLE